MKTMKPTRIITTQLATHNRTIFMPRGESKERRKRSKKKLKCGSSLKESDLIMITKMLHWSSQSKSVKMCLG